MQPKPLKIQKVLPCPKVRPRLRTIENKETAFVNRDTLRLTGTQHISLLPRFLFHPTHFKLHEVKDSLYSLKVSESLVQCLPE